MNIFVLDYNPKIAASYHCDKHVVKMVLEYCQLLCNAHHIFPSKISLRLLTKPTHINHPCSKWVRASTINYIWLYQLYIHTAAEYYHRYNKIHKAYSRFNKKLFNLPDIPDIGSTPFVQCVPYDLKCDSVVEAYRNYYMKDKRNIVTWKPPSFKPRWYL